MDLKLSLKKRDKFGKKAKQLVEDGSVLGNLYGKGVDSIAVVGEYREVNKIVNEAGHNIPIDLEVEGGTTEMALVHDIERDNITQRLHHVTFQIIKKGQKVQTDVPVHLIGDAPAVKLGMIVVNILDHLEVEAIPSKIPEAFEVSIEGLVDENSQITVAEVFNEDPDVDILNDPELLIAKVEIPRAEVEEEPEEDEEDVDAADVPSDHGGDEDSSEDGENKEKSPESKEEQAG